MTKASHKARDLSRRLRVLEAVDALVLVGGGRETASTSTSGTPAAGDDTVGDSSTTIGFAYGALTVGGTISP